MQTLAPSFQSKQSLQQLINRMYALLQEAENHPEYISLLPKLGISPCLSDVRVALANVEGTLLSQNKDMAVK